MGRLILLLTNRQTDKQTNADENITSLSEVTSGIGNATTFHSVHVAQRTMLCSNVSSVRARDHFKKLETDLDQFCSVDSPGPI